MNFVSTFLNYLSFQGYPLEDKTITGNFVDLCLKGKREEVFLVRVDLLSIPDFILITGKIKRDKKEGISISRATRFCNTYNEYCCSSFLFFDEKENVFAIKKGISFSLLKKFQVELSQNFFNVFWSELFSEMFNVLSFTSELWDNKVKNVHESLIEDVVRCEILALNNKDKQQSNILTNKKESFADLNVDQLLDKLEVLLAQSQKNKDLDLHLEIEAVKEALNKIV